MLVVAATEREIGLVRDADTLCCGIGPVEAALNTARALAERRPDGVLHIGIAGALRLEPSSLVLGSEAVYCDIVDSASTLPRVTKAEPDRRMLAAARQAPPEAHVLPIATCARVGGGRPFEVEAMEGFSVLRAALLAGVPAVELRAISNAPSEPDRGRWRFEEAFAALARAVPPLLESLMAALGEQQAPQRDPLERLIGLVDDDRGPDDVAENHDRYAYGGSS
jgi:futalosine hydrolase